MTDTRPDTDPHAARQQRLRMLRGSIKLLLGIGFVFLLVPFFKSIPWPKDEIPEGSVRLGESDIAAGETRHIRIDDDNAVFVTRASAPLQAALEKVPAGQLWSPSAPGLLQQEWWVVNAKSAQDEALQFLPATGGWPGGFTAASGAAWDVAGRALKPGPGHPSGYAMTVQNLLPMPWKTHDDGILLMPLPPAPPPAQDDAP